MSPCIGCATTGTTDSLYNSYRAPDKDTNPLNPFYRQMQNPLEALKSSYLKTRDAVKDAVQQFTLNSKYNLGPVGSGYAPNYGSSEKDFGRHAAVSDNYKFRHVQP